MTNYLCQLAGEWRGGIPDSGLAFEEKRDGWRALYFRGHDGKPRLWTRQGHRIEGADHVIHQLGLMERAAGQPLFIDGEFQVDGSLEATKRWCEQGWRRGGEAGAFYAFDVVPFVNWLQGGWEKPWHYRKALLLKLAEQAQDPALSWEWRAGSGGRDGDSSAVVVLQDSWAFDASGVLAEARRVWSAGGEGLMLKNAEAPYRRKRCDAWLKVKRDGSWLRRAA